METYSFLRAVADSWVLLALTLFFVGMILFVFRPGSRALQKRQPKASFDMKVVPPRRNRRRTVDGR